MSFSATYQISDRPVVIKRHGLPDFDLGQLPVSDIVSTFDELMVRISEFEVDIFEILGLRNLSSFVGEIFAASCRRVTGSTFRKNPHQDGYPDLLLMDGHGENHWKCLEGRLQEKGPFSPFATGGIEVKATCGSTESAKMLSAKGSAKPQIGDHRLPLLKGYDWKAHHRDTNNLLAILWDFIEGRPGIAGIFYSNQLIEADWGKIVQPREGGGRTTSVSIMQKSGIRKMYEGAICIRKNPDYRPFLKTRNDDKQSVLWK
jgi:hypothetical protein